MCLQDALILDSSHSLPTDEIMVCRGQQEHVKPLGQAWGMWPLWLCCRRTCCRVKKIKKKHLTYACSDLCSNNDFRLPISWIFRGISCSWKVTFSHFAHEKFKATCVGLNYFRAADFCYYATTPDFLVTLSLRLCANPFFLRAAWFIPPAGWAAVAVSPGQWLLEAQPHVLSLPRIAPGCVRNAGGCTFSHPSPHSTWLIHLQDNSSLVQRWTLCLHSPLACRGNLLSCPRLCSLSARTFLLSKDQIFLFSLSFYILTDVYLYFCSSVPFLNKDNSMFLSIWVTVLSPFCRDRPTLINSKRKWL